MPEKLTPKHKIKPKPKRLRIRPKSAVDMTEKELIEHRSRAKSGDMYELKGSYGEPVFVPKTKSDVDPGGARRKNIKRLKGVKKFLREHKKTESGRA
jgi:hypothetical protein